MLGNEAKPSSEEILNSWLLISTPVPALLAMTVYLYFVLRAGPRFMATRKPYQLRSTMMLYNILQIAFNSWMFFKIVVKTDTIPHLMEHSCVPKRVERLTYALHLFSWCYFLSKLLDLFDTQGAVLNMFVHIVMYGYYFLASLGPLVRPFLWWKKYLTKLQLGQFAVVLMYLGYLNYNGCPVSRVFNYIWITNVAVIAAFFINFYIQTYLKEKPEVNNNKLPAQLDKNKLE